MQVSGDNKQVLSGRYQVSSESTISVNISSESMTSDKQININCHITQYWKTVPIPAICTNTEK